MGIGKKLKQKWRNKMNEIEILNSLIREEESNLEYYHKKIEEVQLKIDVYKNRLRLIEKIQAEESERDSE